MKKIGGATKRESLFIIGTGTMFRWVLCYVRAKVMRNNSCCKEEDGSSRFHCHEIEFEVAIKKYKIKPGQDKTDLF